LLETKAGKPVFNALTRQGEEHPLEEVGRRLRALMPWLSEKQLVDRTRN
jgi:ketol-acid reductoisomerase